MLFDVKRNTLFALHAFAVSMFAVFFLSELARAASLYGLEPSALSITRASTALLCCAFSVSHLLLLAHRRVASRSALFFYPLCILLGIVTAYVVGGSVKKWAPATDQVALISNILGFAAVGLVLVLCAFSSFRFTTVREKSNA